MYINFWYPIAASDEVTNKAPTRVEILGTKVVAYRDDKGNAHVIADTCVHRGGALGKGWVRDNCIVCPYHGWRFDKDGKCVEIPTLANDENSLWRTVLGDEARSSRSRRRALGIGMRVTQKPGRVTVARVYSGAPADGHLQPGDEILGVNGRLLSLGNPNADLRRMIQSAGQNETVALRILRDSKYVDVEITPGPAEPKQGQGGAVEALGRLARLGQALRYCTFTVFASRPDQYVARVTLGFQAPAPTSRPASKPADTPDKKSQK